MQRNNYHNTIRGDCARIFQSTQGYAKIFVEIQECNLLQPLMPNWGYISMNKKQMYCEFHNCDSIPRELLGLKSIDRAS